MDNATDNFIWTYIETPSFCKEIGLIREDVESIAVGGGNDEAVHETAGKDYAATQFASEDTAKMIEACAYLGDGYVTTDRQKAIEFIVWMAAWDIADDGNF